MANEHLENFDIETLDWELTKEELYEGTGYFHLKLYHEEQTFEFIMKLNKVEDGWYPVWVSHGSKLVDCPFCKGTLGISCLGFQGNLRDLFEKITSHKSLRLRFLLGGTVHGE